MLNDDAYQKAVNKFRLLLQHMSSDSNEYYRTDKGSVITTSDVNYWIIEYETYRGPRNSDVELHSRMEWANQIWKQIHDSE